MNLTKVSPIPRSENAENKRIVLNAKLYKPNNLGIKSRARIMMNMKEPNFAIKVVENW